MWRAAIRLITLVVLLNFSVVGLAASKPPAPKTISLYEQPDTRSKVVAEIKPGQAIIPIFHKDDWLKVGDPSNGDIGWVQKQALAQAGIPVVFTRTVMQPLQQNGQQGYRVMQYYGPRPLDKRQLENRMWELQRQQIDMQKIMNQLMAESAADFAELDQQMHKLDNMPWQQFRLMVPVLQPVIIIPEQPAASASPKQRVTGTTSPPASSLSKPAEKQLSTAPKTNEDTSSKK